MKKNLALFVLLAVITTGIYLLIFSKCEALFFINLVSALLSEAALLYGLNLITTREALSVQQASLRMLLFIFAVLLFGWTTLFSIVHPEQPYTVLFIGQLIILLTSAIYLGTSVFANKAIDNEQSSLNKATETKRVSLIPFDDWGYEMESSVVNEDEVWKMNVLSDVRNIVERMKTIPANKLLTNQEFVEEINTRTQNIRSLVSRLKVEDLTELREQISTDLSLFRKFITTRKQNLK